MAPIDRCSCTSIRRPCGFLNAVTGAGHVRRGTGPQGRGFSLRPENPQALAWACSATMCCSRP